MEKPDTAGYRIMNNVQAEVSVVTVHAGRTAE
jgi:hypothetical protein